MTKQAYSVTATAVFCLLLVLIGPVVGAVCPGLSASINATATVVEPVGLVAANDLAVPFQTATNRGSSSLLLRLPESQTALIMLSAPGVGDVTITPATVPPVVQTLDRELLRRYSGGTLTVVFPND